MTFHADPFPLLRAVPDAPSDDWVAAVAASAPPAPGRDGESGTAELEQRAVRAESRVEALERALISRPALEQAKGILMAVFGLSADAAFDALVWTSQHANIRVSVVADTFVDDMRESDLGQRTRDHVTALLANSIGRPAPS